MCDSAPPFQTAGCPPRPDPRLNLVRLCRPNRASPRFPAREPTEPLSHSEGLVRAPAPSPAETGERCPSPPLVHPTSSGGGAKQAQPSGPVLRDTENVWVRFEVEHIGSQFSSSPCSRQRMSLECQGQGRVSRQRPPAPQTSRGFPEAQTWTSEAEGMALGSTCAPAPPGLASRPLHLPRTSRVPLPQGPGAEPGLGPRDWNRSGGTARLPQGAQCRTQRTR